MNKDILFVCEWSKGPFSSIYMKQFCISIENEAFCTRQSHVTGRDGAVWWRQYMPSKQKALCATKWEKNAQAPHRTPSCLSLLTRLRAHTRALRVPGGLARAALPRDREREGAGGDEPTTRGVGRHAEHGERGVGLNLFLRVSFKIGFAREAGAGRNLSKRTANTLMTMTGQFLLILGLRLWIIHISGWLGRHYEKSVFFKELCLLSFSKSLDLLLKSVNTRLKFHRN